MRQRRCERVRIARASLAGVPQLIPVFGHRYLPGIAGQVGHPVLSVYQTDIIYYGADLTDYLRREWLGYEAGGDRDRAARSSVPFWTGIVEGEDDEVMDAAKRGSCGTIRGADLMIRRERPNGVPPQPDEACCGRVAFAQAHAGTRGQSDRPPPLATPMHGDHDAKCICAGQVRCCLRCGASKSHVTPTNATRKHKLDSITTASPVLAS
jgi:hypothetical protein